MAHPKRGEVWLVDLGLAAKVRPCLLLTDFPADDELALVTILPHTTAIRGNRFWCRRAPIEMARISEKLGSRLGMP